MFHPMTELFRTKKNREFDKELTKKIENIKISMY